MNQRSNRQQLTWLLYLSISEVQRAELFFQLKPSERITVLLVLSMATDSSTQLWMIFSFEFHLLCISAACMQWISMQTEFTCTSFLQALFNKTFYMQLPRRPFGCSWKWKDQQRSCKTFSFDFLLGEQKVWTCVHTEYCVSSSYIHSQCFQDASLAGIWNEMEDWEWWSCLPISWLHHAKTRMVRDSICVCNTYIYILVSYILNFFNVERVSFSPLIFVHLYFSVIHIG